MAVRAGRWYCWVEGVRGALPSPLASAYIHESEITWVGRTKVRITGGAWVGLETTRLRISEYQRHDLTVCDDCGCTVDHSYYGGTCRVVGAASTRTDVQRLAGNTCSCGHTFCPECGQPKRRGANTCAVCTQEILLIRGRYRRAFAGLRPLWRQGNPQYSARFNYEPTLYVAGESEYDIVNPEALVRHPWIHITGSLANPQVWITRDQQGRHWFQHYHRDCWGEANLSGFESYEALHRRCEEILHTVNDNSPRIQRPRGLPPLAALEAINRRPVSVWNRMTMAVDEQQRSLLQGILDRQNGAGLNVPDGVMVVGCGGVGWHAAMQLGLIGVPTLVLVDHDTIDRTNLTRIPAPLAMEGRWKCGILADVLNNSTWRRSFRGVFDVVYYRDRVSDPTWIDVPDSVSVLLDTTDNIAAQRESYAIAQQHGWRYVRAGYDGGWHVTVSSRQPPDWEVEGAGDGYAVPAWIGGAQFAASLAVTKITKMPELECSFSILDVLGGLHDKMLEVPPVNMIAGLPDNPLRGETTSTWQTDDGDAWVRRTVQTAVERMLRG